MNEMSSSPLFPEIVGNLRHPGLPSGCSRMRCGKPWSAAAREFLSKPSYKRYVPVTSHSDNANARCRRWPVREGMT
jgi:hypothetical protein